MDKKFYEKYFGRNLARIFYLISVGFLGFGVFQVIMGNPYGGVIFCTMGVVLFFLTSHKQVSDKHIDELVQKHEKNYIAEKIDGKALGKETLKGEDFSVFSGFIRDSGDVRFKAGSDQKMRTSRFYVTAISSKKNDFKVFTTIYDMLSESEPIDKSFFTKGAAEIEFSKEIIEFPRGNYKCAIKAKRNDNSEEFIFYLPNDALADKLTEKLI